MVSCVEQVEPNGFVRINATLQEYSETQPWDRKQATQRNGLGALLEGGRVLTTSEMVAHHVYLELESADGSEKVPAQVVAIDRGANLALLEPAVEEETFLAELTPLALAPELKIKDRVETWQLEDNGQTTVTETAIYAVDVVSSYSGSQYFFSYLLKGSLQSSSNSYTVPILSNGQLAGLLTSYNSEEQISEVLASQIIQHFLDDAADGDYVGFPTLGIGGATVDDESFRQWLKLDEGENGIYITRVAEDTAAQDCGLQVGDVLLSVDGYDLDLNANYDDEVYGKLSWSHLIRGRKTVGDAIELVIKRDGEVQNISTELRANNPGLIPAEFPEGGPQYLLKGGVIFQQLTQKYLQAYGSNWASQAPLNLLDIYYQTDEYTDQFEEAVIITGVIPSQTTVGYEQIRNCLVQEVNGVPITKMADLETGFASVKDGIHALKLSESPYVMYLDAQSCDMVDRALMQQGLPALKRIQ